MTRGYGLTARHVIHTVGPVWHGGRHGEDEALANCYRNSLALAAEHGLARIAFPAISCGVYGYPIDQAVQIAVDTVRAWTGDMPTHVLFCCFDAAMLTRYEAALAD